MALYIRTTKPESGNRFYNRRDTGGLSPCIWGNSEHSEGGRLSGLNVLPNCVGFASGAFNETVNSVNGKGFQYQLACMAAGFICKASAMGLKCARVSTSRHSYTNKNSAGEIYTYKDNVDNIIYISPSEDTPTVGSIMVWGGDWEAGHVAYVCEVVDKDTVKTCESNWSSSPRFIACKTRTRNQNSSYCGKNNWGSKKFQGFVINPVVTDDLITQISGRPSIIDVVEDEDAGKLIISYDTGPIENVTSLVISYKFTDKEGKETPVQSININVSSAGQFSELIADPNHPKIQVDIVKTMTKDGKSWDIPGSSFTRDLKVVDTVNCMHIFDKDSNKYLQGVPYIFHLGKWVKCSPHMLIENEWIKIKNKKQEVT